MILRIININISHNSLNPFVLQKTSNDMNESEKVENNVDAKEIRDKLLKALHLGPGELATALGINYQRIYDLGSGRTKKFNAGMVNMIVAKFPQVNATFLYTGKGEPLKEGAAVASTSDVSEIISMSRQLRDMMEKLTARSEMLDQRALRLEVKERELNDRERHLNEREKALSERAAELAEHSI